MKSNQLEYSKKFERLKIKTKIIYYSTSPDPVFLEFLNLSSSCGLIRKGCSILELKICLKNILEGNKVIYTFTSSKDLREQLHKSNIQSSQVEYAKLTERELEIYDLLAG
jgi:DNA-binding NarL/FixJ family response regulator